MLKTMITLLRGSAAAAGEEFADRNALLILDQQIRDASAALNMARRSLALAIARHSQENDKRAIQERQIADLEMRVTAALDRNAEGPAREGAEAIARLEAERDASRRASDLFATEIEKLRSHVGRAELRIAQLDRGRKIARASESVRALRKGRIEDSSPFRATLSDAEHTLERLRDRQIESEAAEDALDDIEIGTGAAETAKRLAAAGFGPRITATADDVLDRLRRKRADGNA